MVPNILTIKDIKSYIAGELSGIYPEHEINALTSIIIKTVLRTSGLHSLAMPESHVLQKHVHEIGRICRELKKGRPLQYILGETSFYNCSIKVTGDTLIPRPETEELVDLVIKENKAFRGSILDIGTGSGCIAIALSVNLPGTDVTGTDISEEALAVAHDNAMLNEAKVKFIKSDILKPDIELFGSIDIIVSNPPYIRKSEKTLMNRNVLDYEPHFALFVPDDSPLIFYRAICDFAEHILVPGGKLYLEINEAMGKKMTDLLLTYKYTDIELIKDINSRDRIIKGSRHD